MYVNLGNEIVAIDVETTGLLPMRGHRVIEIAAVRISGNGLGETFHSLIDCGRPVPFGVQEIHGITDEMLIGQPDPALVFDRFRRFVDNSVLVAHNAAFDRAFIRNEFGRLGWNFTNRMQCTLALSHRVLPGLPDHRLETVFQHLFPDDAKTIQLHRAINDARVAARIWLKMKKRMVAMQDLPMQTILKKVS
jgi:DNA polymerase-3 subunit epsilon